MNPTPQPTDAVAPVSTPSRRWWATTEYLVFSLGIALLLLTAYLIVTAPGLFKVDLPGALLGIAAFLIGLTILDRLPRDILVTSDGVEFRYFLSRVVLKWEQLTPPALAGKGFVSFRAVPGVRGVWGPLTVTADQAREILSNPNCPSFGLPEDLSDELSR